MLVEKKIPAHFIFGNHGPEDFQNLISLEKAVNQSISRSNDGLTIVVMELANRSLNSSNAIFNLTQEGFSPMDAYYMVTDGCDFTHKDIRSSASRSLAYPANVYTYCTLTSLDDISSKNPNRTVLLCEGIEKNKTSELLDDLWWADYYLKKSLELVDQGEFRSASYLWAEYINLSFIVHSEREQRLTDRLDLITRLLLKNEYKIDGVVIKFGTAHTSLAKKLDASKFEITREIAEPLPYHFDPPAAMLRKFLHDPTTETSRSQTAQAILGTRYACLVCEKGKYYPEYADRIDRFARTFDSRKKVNKFSRMVKNLGFEKAAEEWIANV